MSTLIATYTSAAGGSERLLLDVAAGLDEPPLIACPDGWLAEQARAAGYTVFVLRARSLHVRASARDRLASTWRLGAHGRELRRLCRDLQPELFVAWGMRSAIAAGPALRGLDQRWIFEHVDLLPGAAIGRAVRAAAARADRVICISHAIARDLDPDGALAGRIEVVHCGVDLARFGGGADAGGAGGADGHGGADALVLGAIVPWKRPDLALEIAALATKELPDLRLRIAGQPLDGSGRELLARMRGRAAQPDLDGHVEFTGQLADPRAALRDAGCLLHCADSEPFGLVLVEALASGTPVVAPAAGGPAEIVDPSCGALYRPGDARAGADALVATLRQRSELSSRARRRAEDAFSLAEMQQRYRELVGRGARAAIAGEDLTLVTVTYNSAPELRRLAASAARHLPGARLIVVDNASADDSRAVAEAAGAHLLAFDENRGFGAAANAGVAAAATSVTALVNPDVELVDASLARLAGDVQPGQLLAPLLLNPDGSRQDSAHPAPASPATALHSLLPGPALPPPLRSACEPWRSLKQRRVAWATAACLVARTDTLRELGPFDASIFLYGEDLDLGIRAGQTVFRPDARVIHGRAHSTTTAFGGENHELLARQRREVVRRNFGSRRAILDDVIELMTFADRALLHRLTGRSARRETERFRARVKAAVTR